MARDSALGRQCGSIANFVKGTIAKIANLPQSLQSSHSPTANPRILERKALIVIAKPSTQAEGFLMRNCSFQGAGAGIYLGDNEQARAVESTIYRKKPTPKPNQNQSNKPNKKEFYNETTSQKHLLPSQSPSNPKRPKV